MPETLTGRTIRDALAGATAALAEAGCETPRLDAELLLADALRVGRAQLVLDGGSPLDPAAAERFAGLIARRVDREPVAYIIGRREFRRLRLTVDPRVLIPRPETELLVEVGLTLSSGARVVDVGTGSGAVALAVKDERPDLEVWGTDLSQAALEVAIANGERLGLEVQWRQADLLEGLAGGFDAVLANLPYVAAGAALAPEIARYEPAGALFAGPDGLGVIRILVSQAHDVALLAVEIGSDQSEAVGELLRGAGFGRVETLSDLAAHDRVVVGRR